jgi:hypothetical protein
MVFLDEEKMAACKECGQVWNLTEYGWKPEPYRGRKRT